MKTISRVLFSLAMGFLVVSSTLAADVTPIFRVAGNKLYLSLDNAADRTSVRIQDAQGFVWVEERVADPGQFKKVFDLQSLPAGTYRLIIESGAQEIIQPLTVADAAVVLDESNRTEYYRADLHQQRKQVQLTLLNPTHSVVRFYVLDPQGKMVYQKTVEGQPLIDEQYDLQQLPAGRYTVVVDNGHEAFTKQVRL